LVEQINRVVCLKDPETSPAGCCQLLPAVWLGPPPFCSPHPAAAATSSGQNNLPGEVANGSKNGLSG